MKVEFKAQFLSVANTKDNSIVTILNAGEAQPQKSKFNDKEELIIVFDVSVEGKKATFSLYEKYKRPLVDAWGDETMMWIGKKFKVLHINGKMEIKPELNNDQPTSTVSV